MAAPLPLNEEARLQALYRLNLLDTPPERAFDCVTRLALDALQVPIALVSLVDRDRQWFKSACGLEATETPRDIAFCAHAILSNDPLVVEDARREPRFADNPAVLGEPHVRFYAGIPLLTGDGFALGTFCVVDTVPRALDATQLRLLQGLAELVRREILNRELALQVEAVAAENRRIVAEHESRFRASFERAAVGIALVGTDGRWLQVNPKLCQIVGYSEQELLPLSFQQITHPDDLGGDLELAAQLLRGDIDTYSLEKRYLRKDGSVVWINLSVSLMHDADGKPSRFVSVIEDIDARKQAEAELLQLGTELEQRVEHRTAELRQANAQLSQQQQALHSSQHQLQTIADNLPIQLAYVDHAQVVRFINDAYRRDTGLTPERALGRHLREILNGSFYDAVAPYIEQALAGERVLFETPTRFRGREQIWSTLYIPELEEGRVIGFFIMSEDITSRKRHELTLIERATRDPLTGLPNRAALLELLQAATQRAAHNHHDMAVLFADLDGFKAVNDQHGHDAGDRVLKQFAARLSGAVRSSDLVARLAGDEFVIVLEGLQGDGAVEERVAEKILLAMQAPFDVGAQQVQLGTSIGLHLHRFDAAASAEQLLACADAAMYAAKRSGKNQLRRYLGNGAA